MINNLLNLFNLNERERKVFSKVLEMGSQPASQIARLLEMPRNTTRDILDKLVKIGLLVRTKEANTQYYSMDSVQNVIRFLEIRKKKTLDQLDQQLEFVKKFSDELQPHKFHKSRPKVTFYEGEDGLRRVYEDTLTSKETIRAYASLKDMYSGLPGYFPEYFKRRAKKKIKIRAIFPDIPEAYERKKFDDAELRESRLVPHETYNFTPEINIYNNKFIIISWLEKLAIMVESQEIVDAMKSVFELSWVGANSVEKTNGRSAP